MKSFPNLFKLSFIALFTYLFFFTLGLKISLFDAYDYMGMAKYNAGFDNWYPFLKTLRPPLLPALLTPFTFLHHYGVSMESIFTYIHLFSLFLSGLFVIGTYSLFRKGMRGEFAALGTFLLMIQPGFVAYSFETMVDIPSGLIMILSVLVYLRFRLSNSNAQFALLCLLISLGVAMKYPMILSLLVFITAHMILSKINGGTWKQIFRDSFYWRIGALSTAIYIAVSVISLIQLHGWTLENIFRAIQPYIDHIPTSQNTEESRMANISFLFSQMTAPLFLLMCVGILIVWKRKNEINIVILMWLTIFLSILSILAGHYEYRYLFLLIPACYYFCGLALQEIFDYVKNKFPDEKLFKFAISAALILLITLPTIRFAKEINSLNSGFYQNDFQRKVAKAASKSKGFIWLGTMYSSYQEDAPFHYEDPFYKIYHYWVNGINFYTGNTPKTFLNDVHYSWIDSITDGDILIYNPILIALQTKFLPPPEAIPPLFIGKVSIKKFVFLEESRNKKVFLNNGNKIELRFENPNTFSIIFSPNTPLTQHYFLWFKLNLSPKKLSNSNYKAIYKFSGNRIWKVESSKEYFNSISELAILNYDSEEFYFDKN